MVPASPMWGFPAFPCLGFVQQQINWSPLASSSQKKSNYSIHLFCQWRFLENFFKTSPHSYKPNIVCFLVLWTKCIVTPLFITFYRLKGSIEFLIIVTNNCLENLLSSLPLSLFHLILSSSEIKWITSAEDTQSTEQDAGDNCVLNSDKTHQLWADEQVQLNLNLLSLFPLPPPFLPSFSSFWFSLFHHR